MTRTAPTLQAAAQATAMPPRRAPRPATTQRLRGFAVVLTMAVACSAAGDQLASIVASADIAFTAPWTSNPPSRLEVIEPASSDLHLAAGTYWLAVVAINNSCYTDIDVFTPSIAGALDNRNNARRIAATGLWPGGPDLALDADAALRVDGRYVHAVPEPGSGMLPAGGLSLAAAALRGRTS